VIVVDASALAAFILREEGWRRLAKYLADAIAPDHVVKEVANAVWRAARLRGLLSEEEAWRAYALLHRMIGKNLVLEPKLKYLDKALEISMARRVTVYDAIYLALALEKELPLLTLDEEQRRAAEALGIRVKP